MSVMHKRSDRRPGTLSRGFSLVELMVAMVLGLIVVAAVVNLVMSIIQSNNQTIQATRLTQELRATAAVIATDIKRARGVEDPFRKPMNVGGNDYRVVTVTDKGTPPFDAQDCVQYSYYSNRADTKPTELEVNDGDYFHAIGIKNGSVTLDSGKTAADATCGDGSALNSPFINITSLDFDRVGRRITITLKGELKNAPDIKRTLTHTIFIRSLAGS